MISLLNVFKFYKTTHGRKIILDNVSMQFNQGTSYGLLGINGAGKSTTMRVIAGSELPNSGTIKRSSKISWPLGFAAGMHPELSGRENVNFVARLYGEPPRSVFNFVDEFSELGSNIDEPFRTYSSGMVQRLAFGLSMAIQFECYLIDEVLAVGDARFQAKCSEHFNRRRAEADIIMISHSMDTIREYCNRCLVLAHGIIHEFSDVDDAIAMYKKLNE